MSTGSLNLEDLMSSIKIKAVKDETLLGWFFENPKNLTLVTQEVIELLEKYRPKLIKQLLRELLKKYTKIVTKIK